MDLGFLQKKKSLVTTNDKHSFFIYGRLCDVLLVTTLKEITKEYVMFHFHNTVYSNT